LCFLDDMGSREELRSLIKATSGVMALIVKRWAEDPVHAGHGYLLCRFFHPADWAQVVDAAGGTPEAVASIALKHAHHVSGLAHDALCNITIQVIVTLSHSPVIAHALTSQNSIFIVTKHLLRFVSDLTTTASVSMVVGRLTICLTYLISYADLMDGLSWVVQVIEGGILQVLVKAAAWISHDMTLTEICIALLGSSLPSHLEFRDSLPAVRRGFQELEDLALNGMERYQVLGGYWTSYKALVEEQLKHDLAGMACGDTSCDTICHDGQGEN